MNSNKNISMKRAQLGDEMSPEFVGMERNNIRQGMTAVVDVVYHGKFVSTTSGDVDKLPTKVKMDGELHVTKNSISFISDGEFILDIMLATFSKAYEIRHTKNVLTVVSKCLATDSYKCFFFSGKVFQARRILQLIQYAIREFINDEEGFAKGIPRPKPRLSLFQNYTQEHETSQNILQQKLQDVDAMVADMNDKFDYKYYEEDLFASNEQKIDSFDQDALGPNQKDELFQKYDEVVSDLTHRQKAKQDGGVASLIEL